VPAEFFVHNLGCKVNRAESDALSLALAAAGGSRAARDEAQVIIVNTCTVTGEAEAKTRKAIRQALAGPLEPWVIATGCAIAIDREAYEALGTRVVAEPDRRRAQEVACELLGLEYGEAHPQTPRQADEGFNTRRGIKIQDGCDNRCSYCIVYRARGPARSLPLATIRDQVLAAEQAGTREVVLTGINIGSYDDGGAGLKQLLEALLEVTDKARIRLSSLEPQHATDELLALIAASRGRICAHLHLPLQSGCDRTLAAMRRPYDTAFFLTRVSQARTLMPQMALTTDVIVGFPAESDEDFRESYEFCQRVGFSRMHVFRYSPRPQTPAAQMEPQVEPEVKASRAAALRTLAAQMREKDLIARIGTTERVLVERRGRGTSEGYHQVELESGLGTGQLVTMRFTGYRDTLMQGLVVE
jgi:threonylcarbamoyladenosine tRNA methylthiotransferase MtaB